MVDIKELQIVGPYTYVAQHYYEMTKEELKCFALEGIYATENADKNCRDAIVDNIIDYLGE